MSYQNLHLLNLKGFCKAIVSTLAKNANNVLTKDIFHSHATKNFYDRLKIRFIYYELCFYSRLLGIMVIDSGYYSSIIFLEPTIKARRLWSECWSLLLLPSSFVGFLSTARDWCSSWWHCMESGQSLWHKYVQQQRSSMLNSILSSGTTCFVHGLRGFLLFQLNFESNSLHDHVQEIQKRIQRHDGLMQRILGRFYILNC